MRFLGNEFKFPETRSRFSCLQTSPFFAKYTVCHGVSVSASSTSASVSMKADVEQGVLVVSCSSLTPHELISGIMGESLSGKREARFGRHVIECFPWHISTKYYDADVHFLLLPERDLVSQSFSKVVEAAVFHMSVDREGFTAMQTWMPFVNEFEPEIRILACDNAPESGPVPRLEIQNWCIENAFEFVELNPDEDEVDDDVEDDFKESNSYLRIRQALHAHSWPKLNLKECPEYTPSPKFKDILTPADAAPVSSVAESNASERVTSLVDESEKIFQDLNVDDESNGDFENLFEKFQEMRAKASQLQGNERLLFAEKTALAFWKAIGGEDEDDTSTGQEVAN